MKSIAIRFIFLCTALTTVAQSTIQRLKIGEKVPDVTVPNIVNYKSSQIKISDFDGKILILDYWFTGCKPCIASWPKLQKLQEQFIDQIQILLVNPLENNVTVEGFIKNWQKRSGTDFTLPSVTSDNLLNQMLPPAGYPTVIWIDRKGVFKAATDGVDLNEENIQAVLDNLEIGSKTLVQNSKFIDLSIPLYINGNGGHGNTLIWTSSLSGYSEEIAPYFAINSDSSGYYITATCHAIEPLIMSAYGRGPFKNRRINNYIRFSTSRIRYEVSDKQKFKPYEGSILQIQNLYNYQILSSVPKTVDELRAAMQEDLQRYFDLDLELTKVFTDCLILTAEDTTLISDFKDEERPRYWSMNSGELSLINVSTDNFIGYLTEFMGGDYNIYPIVDETGFKGLMDIRFEDETIISDYQKLSEYLYKRYKMKLEKEFHETEVLIVRERNGNMFGEGKITAREQYVQERETERGAIQQAYLNQQWDEYQRMAIPFVSKYFQDDFRELQRYAWEFCKSEAITDKQSLQQAIGWARRSVELNSTFSPYNQGVLAALLLKSGDKKNGMIEAKKALKTMDVIEEITDVTLYLQDKIGRNRSK